MTYTREQVYVLVEINTGARLTDCYNLDIFTDSAAYDQILVTLRQQVPENVLKLGLKLEADNAAQN